MGGAQVRVRVLKSACTYLTRRGGRPVFTCDELGCMLVPTQMPRAPPHTHTFARSRTSAHTHALCAPTPPCCATTCTHGARPPMQRQGQEGLVRQGQGGGQGQGLRRVGQEAQRLAGVAGHDEGRHGAQPGAACLCLLVLACACSCLVVLAHAYLCLLMLAYACLCLLKLACLRLAGRLAGPCACACSRGAARCGLLGVV